MTNINHVNEFAKNITVPKDLLDSIYVGQHAVSNLRFGKLEIPVHSGSFTDVNIWNRALSINEMINWTNCRYLI